MVAKPANSHKCIIHWHTLMCICWFLYHI